MKKSSGKFPEIFRKFSDFLLDRPISSVLLTVDYALPQVGLFDIHCGSSKIYKKITANNVKNGLNQYIHNRIIVYLMLFSTIVLTSSSHHLIFITDHILYTLRKFVNICNYTRPKLTYSFRCLQIVFPNCCNSCIGRQTKCTERYTLNEYQLVSRELVLIWSFKMSRLFNYPWSFRPRIFSDFYKFRFLTKNVNFLAIKYS